MEQNSKKKQEVLIAQKIFCSTSSDNEYITKIGNNFISCTCPAGGRKQLCKHIREIILENIEQIKVSNPEFYTLLQEALDAQNSNVLTQEEKKEIYSKIIKVDKETAEAAYNNTILLEIPTSLETWAKNKAIKFIASINKQIRNHKEWLKMGFIDKETYKKCIHDILSVIKYIKEYDFETEDDI